jgi:hypothetical protein
MHRAFLILSVFAAAPTSPQKTVAMAPVPRSAARDTVKIGTYDLEITTDDGTMVGSLVVKRDKDHLAATINAGGRVPAVKSFAKDGAQYVLTAGHDNFTVVYKFTFVRDSVAGSFSMTSGLTGTVLGAYKR